MSQCTLAVFQHHPVEGVGRIGLWAQHHNIKLVCFYAPEDLPNSLTDYDGLIVLGGPMNVADNPMWMQTEVKLIQQALTLQRPILAICLGAQLLATQLGGQIIEMPAPELGWQDIRFNDGSILTVPQWHEQAITLPKDIAVLASSGQCPVQMYRHQHAIGLQFHPEWDAKQIEQLAEFFADECPLTNDQHTAKYQSQLASFLFALLDAQFTF